MNKSNTVTKRTAGDVLREVGHIGRALRADQFATAALTDALARKKRAEKRLLELGRTPKATMDKLIRDARKAEVV
jgi:hypothetical protein